VKEIGKTPEQQWKNEDSKDEGELHGHGERNETGRDLPGHGVEGQLETRGIRRSKEFCLRSFEMPSNTGEKRNF
jgi:hypothetical protein